MEIFSEMIKKSFPLFFGENYFDKKSNYQNEH